MLYVFFWVILRHLNFICQRFGTLCLFHLHRQVGKYNPTLRQWISRLFWKRREIHCRRVGLYLPTCLWKWNRQSVPKRRHIKFRCRGITQKKTYNLQFATEIYSLSDAVVRLPKLGSVNYVTEETKQCCHKRCEWQWSRSMGRCGLCFMSTIFNNAVHCKV